MTGPQVVAARPCVCPCDRYGHAHRAICTRTAETTLSVYSAITDTTEDRHVCAPCRTAVIAPVVVRLHDSHGDLFTREVPVIVFDIPAVEAHAFEASELEFLLGGRMNILVPSGHTVRGTVVQADPVHDGRTARIGLAVDTVDDDLVGTVQALGKNPSEENCGSG